jgi:peptidoglycan hydrolase CwlO-like protein
VPASSLASILARVGDIFRKKEQPPSEADILKQKIKEVDEKIAKTKEDIRKQEELIKVTEEELKETQELTKVSLFLSHRLTFLADILRRSRRKS